MLRNEADNIEMQAVDDASYETVSNVAECLLNYQYVTLRNLNTGTHLSPMKKSVQAPQAAETEDVEMEEKPKLVIHLAKASDFDKIYDEFEDAQKAMAQEGMSAQKQEQPDEIEQ